MLSGKYISIGEIINEIYRDRAYKYELPQTDAIEWAVEAMELIGAPMALTNKQEVIRFDNNRAKIPLDLVEINQIAGSFSGSYPFAMTVSGSNYSYTINSKFTLSEDILVGANIDISLLQPIGQDINGNPVYPIQDKSISFPNGTTDGSNYRNINFANYSINNNYIFTNFKTGYLFISYSAILVDCDGLPMIPDDRRYKQAVKAYICKNIDYILYRKGEITREIFNYSETEWLFYVSSASNKAKIPNIDGMQSLLNQVKLVSSRYGHNKFFNNSNY